MNFGVIIKESKTQLINCSKIWNIKMMS